MRVIGYTKVIPPGKALKPNKENHKLDIIKNFIEGVRMAGDNGLVYNGFEMMDCDVAIMQGFLHDNSCLLYTSPSPRYVSSSSMASSA